MNRREFVKLLGQAAAVSGIALVVGLPEVHGEPSGPNSGEGPSGMSSEKIARWDGTAWSALAVGPDGVRNYS